MARNASLPRLRLWIEYRFNLRRLLELLATPAEVTIAPPPARARRRDRIDVPLLYLHGADDGCIAASTTDGAEAFFAADYRRELLPGAGHFLAAEQPAALAARITACLA